MKYSCQGHNNKTPYHIINPLQDEPVSDIFSTDGSPRRISLAVSTAEQDDALEAGAAALEAGIRVEHGFRRLSTTPAPASTESNASPWPRSRLTHPPTKR